jgi:hypothetical protein
MDALTLLKNDHKAVDVQFERSRPPGRTPAPPTSRR